MTKVTAAEVLTTQSSRAFIQVGGARPTNPTGYYGQSAPYAVIQAVTIPINGPVTVHYTGDPNIVGAYRPIARTLAVPPNPAATLHMYEKRGALNKLLSNRCPFTAYLAFGDCNDISDLVYGWSSKLELYPDSIIGSVNGGNRGEFAADNLIEDQVPMTPREIYEVGAMGFGSVAGTEVTTEVQDATYGNLVRCGNCGNQNNGTQWQYMVVKHSTDATLSPDDSAVVVYSTNGGQTWTSVAITGIGVTVDPTFIEVVGTYLVVGVTTENAYYYSSINQATGVPGAFTKVTTGFVATKTPTDIFVVNPNQIFFSANGGYVYESTNITLGVSPATAGGATTANLSRIHGDGNNTLVAAGTNGIVLISTNGGISWSVSGTTPANTTLQGLDVRDQSRYWVCGSNGSLYYTVDGGATWSAIVLPNSPTDLRDVRFVTDEIGWVVGATTTPTGLVYWTPNGGQLWSTTGAAPRMTGVPTTGFQRANRVAVPSTSNSEISANNALIVGLGSVSDGVALLGQANYF